MNYLSHFVWNHQVCGLADDPYFVMGVALPDLWPYFSRRRRLNWRSVRAAADASGTAGQLRDGLLNHAEADRRFHSLPLFVRWQREIKATVAAPGVHTALLEFLSHVTIELALDHRLVVEDDSLPGAFYTCLAACDPQVVEHDAAALGAVDATGLADGIRTFIARRGLHHYATQPGLELALDRLLSLVDVPIRPPDALGPQMITAAIQLVRPADLWPALK